jgi:hypothetical protein
MSDGTLNFPTRATPPASPDVGRWKIWVDSNGKPKITDSSGTTIGFEPLYGSSFNEIEKDVIETNNTTTFQNYETLNYTVESIDPLAIYEMEINFIWNFSSGANDYVGRFVVNGAQFKEPFQDEPKDAGADQRKWNGFKYRITGAQLATLTGTIAWEFRSSNAGNTARTYYAYINLKRVK